MFDYSIASIKDYKNIQLFIKENWSKDHILCKNNRVFEHYFLRGNELQFFLAKDKDKNIVGILGYITNTQFDPKIVQDVAWLSMWMSKKNLSEPCGIKLINYLESNIDTDYIASMGVGSDVIPIYERMGYITGKMNHLLKPVEKLIQQKNKTIEYKISRINNNEIFEELKKAKYIKNKYLSTSFYDYICFSIEKEGKEISLIVGRLLFDESNNNSIFRIVDFAGDFNGISIFARNVSNELFEREVNYIDILLSDISEIEKGIFEICDNQNFLPLYFEPLINEYKVKNFCYKKLTEVSYGLNIITGDCDQERPNKLNE